MGEAMDRHFCLSLLDFFKDKTRPQKMKLKKSILKAYDVKDESTGDSANVGQPSNNTAGPSGASNYPPYGSTVSSGASNYPPNACSNTSSAQQFSYSQDLHQGRQPTHDNNSLFDGSTFTNL